MTLEEHLGAHYSAVVVRRANVAALKAAFKQALEDDEALKEAAKARLAAIKADRNLIDRCFISKTHANILEEVLK